MLGGIAESRLRASHSVELKNSEQPPKPLNPKP